MSAVNESRRNREAWLEEFVRRSLPLIRERTGLTLHKPVKISCGFPLSGGRPRKSGTFVAGECFVLPPSTERQYHQIFVHPMLVRPVDVGGTVLHELLHAMLPHGVGHRKPFSRAATKLGLEGKPTKAGVEEGSDLASWIEEQAKALGEYPHEGLAVGGGPKQTTRLIKVMCPLCGYTIRVTYKWLDEAGAPICPQCNLQMEETGIDGEAALPLYPVDQNVEFKVKAIKRHVLDRTQFDPRWSIFMNRKGRVVHWWVLDYGETDPATGIALVNGKPVLGLPAHPIRTIATSREDAVALLEALRDGTMSYDDIDEHDHEEPEDEDYGEPGDWSDDDEFLEEDEEEAVDTPESEDDPRFQWEKDRGITIESIDPEAEREKRERWVNTEEA